MADRKSVERALKAVDKMRSRTLASRFYVHIDWRRRLVSVHGEHSPELDPLAYDDEIPDSAEEVFGETDSGVWKGYFESYLEAIGYSKLLNDVHHKLTGQYMLIEDVEALNGKKAEHATAI